MSEEERKAYLSKKSQEMVIDFLRHMEKLFDDPRDFLVVLSFFISYLWTKFLILMPGKMRKSLTSHTLTFMKKTTDEIGDYDFKPEDIERWESEKSLDEN